MYVGMAPGVQKTVSLWVSWHAGGCELPAVDAGNQVLVLPAELSFQSASPVALVSEKGAAA